MTMILNLPPQLAGGARLQTLDPSWNHPPTPPTTSETTFDPSEGPSCNSSLRLARDAAKQHPQNPLAHARLAQAAQAAGEIEEATGAARRALTLALDTANAPAAHAAITVLNATGHGDELTVLVDDPRAAHLPQTLRAGAAIAAGELSAALGVLTDLADTASDSPQTLSLLTWLHIKRGEYRQALTSGRRAQRAGASGLALYTNLGYAHAALGNLPQAIKLTRQALTLAPAHRAVALNLVLYHKLSGQQDEALALLDRLRDGGDLDIQLALATAAVMAYAREHDDARRVLQRVRASAEWAHATASRRAHLEANLAFLRWKTGAADDHTTITSMRRALIATGYQSVSIAYLLCNLLIHSRDASLLANIIDRMRKHHDLGELAGMRMALALLEQDPVETLRLAVEWSETDVLNPNAASYAVLLTADLTGDYRQAAEFGLRALARAPSHLTLLNNTVFALALAGEHVRARRIIDTVKDAGDLVVEITATRGLVALMAGEAECGLHGYRDAWDLARAKGDEQLADRVAINAVLACHTAGLGVPVILDDALLARFAATVRSRAGFWVLAVRLQRELALQLPDGSSADGAGGEDAGYERPSGLPVALKSGGTHRQLEPGS